MRKLVTCLAILLSLSIVNVCYADSSIVLGTTTISLGDDVSTVVNKLKPSCILIKLQGIDSYMVRSVTGPPYTHLGSISFINGKVSRVTKDWGNYYEIEQSENIIGIIEQLIKDKANFPYIEIDRHITPQGSTLNMTMTFPDSRKINLIIFKPRDYKPTVILSEEIGQ